MRTLKLYEYDAYISEFKAEVLSCTPIGKSFEVILDKTAFFPEGGGQPADLGEIAGVPVTDVRFDDEVIIHMLKKPVPTGTVDCKIDWETRFRRMQNHSGEHILSGVAHKLYGCTNVGFHMGNEVTVDFDIELSDDQVNLIESTANQAIYDNVNIYADFPSPDTLKTLEYRSKLDLTENVRIVTIEGYDICACCAPHVKKSGEIGIIKVLSSMRHRGGTRLQIICGKDAFEDYCIKTRNLYQIAVKLCAKHNRELEAFTKLCQENSDLKQSYANLNNELIHLKTTKTDIINGITIYFEQSNDMTYVRNLALESAKKHNGISAVFSGNDDNYKYAVASVDIGVKEFGNELRKAFSAKGGGSDELIQGNISATKYEIIEFLNNRVNI